MPAFIPTRAADSTRTARIHKPHSPPPPRRPARLSGADLSASIAVFLIALPLSLGIALATGAPLQAGLVAAAVGGLVAGRLGGSPLQVSGPAAGLTVVTAELIHTYGWRTTCAVTALAGLAQIGLGCLRVARSALAVSPAIVHGMLAGIGVTIAVAQLHIVLGGTPQSSVLANLRLLPRQLADTHPAALTTSLLTLTLLLAWPRLPGRAGRALRKVPAALVAVTGATLFAALTDLRLPQVDLPSWRSHALAGLPEGPVTGIAAAVLTITLVCSVQSLLGAVAVDKLVASRPGPGARVSRSGLDRELLGQGAANIVSGVLGGLPVAGVAVRSSANVRAGATGRNSTMLHGLWVVAAALLLVPVLELIPLAALGALVMAVGLRMVSLHHIRTVTRHREVLVYAVTTPAVIFVGVLEGVALGVAVAVGVALHRLTRTRITHGVDGDGVHHVRVRGQLTFLAVPRLSRTLHLVPPGTRVLVEHDGSFMDHAAFESLQDWGDGHAAEGGSVEIAGRAGQRIAEAAGAAHSCCRPWTPWRNHHCDRPREEVPAPVAPPAERAAGLSAPAADGFPAGTASTGTSPSVPPSPYTPSPSATGREAPRSPEAPRSEASRSEAPRLDPLSADAPPPTGSSPAGSGSPAVGAPTGAVHQLASGISAFQRNTAPQVRAELARLAREGQRPSQLFVTCADSRVVTSMITSSGPGDLFVVRNVGNLVPLPGEESGDDSVAAAIEYAVDLLKVRSITVCGHSGCGAMTALLTAPADGASTSLKRWLRHGLASLERMKRADLPWARLGGRASADAVEQLCLTNVVQQLDHLRAYEPVARGLVEGRLELHGMYFHVGEAQAYLLSGGDHVFDRVHAASLQQAPA